MNLFPIEPKFEIGTKGFNDVDDNGHKLDLLNRGEFGQRLTDLVDRTEQPLVIALDGPWGSGKSHFLKLWAGAHKLELGGKAEVIYFDAFENDFLDDPLVSLVAKLAKDAPERGLAANAMKKVKTAAAPLLKMGARIGLAVVTAGGSEVVGAVGDAAIREIGKTAEEKIDEFWKTETTRIAAMSEFREALEALTKKEDGSTQKIVFIIDELDRCRPDYALQMLEIIKHFFTVPKVHFVLGANIHALEHSVRSRYGQGQDATKYLQKFVFLTMSLPAFESNRAGVLMTRIYYETIAGQYIRDADLKNLLDEYLEQFFLNDVLSLRDIQRILTVVALAASEVENKVFGYRVLLVGSALLKVLHASMYLKLRSHNAPLDEVALTLMLRPYFHDVLGKKFSRLWIIWAMMLEPARLADEGIPPEEIDLFKKAFDSWGDQFSWRIADVCLAKAFDTFTLPAP